MANPFLALAALIAWLAALRRALASRNLVLSAIVVLAFLGVVRALHFHCRDCGGTGWLFRWRDHACDAVLTRQRANRVRRWRGPTPTVQMALWMYLFVSLAIAAALLHLIF